MTKTVGLCLGMMIVCSLLGACRTTYNIQGKEAVRAMRTLGGGEASGKKEKVVVRAKNTKSEESVWIELRASDYVGLRRCPQDLKQDIENREEWGNIEFLATRLDCVDIQFVQPLGTRGRLFWSGVGLTGGGFGIQALVGLAGDELGGPSWTFIPYYGSFRMMAESWDNTSEDCSEDGNCSLHVLVSAWATLFFAAEVVGPILILTGLLLPDERLRDGPFGHQEEFTWTPSISPFAEGGLLLTWRY